MQVQSINNQNSSIRFKAQREEINSLAKASDFVNLDDTILREIAYEYSHDEKQEKKQRNSLFKTFLAIPIVDALSKGVLTETVQSTDKLGNIIKEGKATLGTKTLEAGRTAGTWAGSLAILGVYSAAKKSVLSNSPKMREFEQNHPFLSFIGDVGIVLGGLMLSRKGINKLKESNPKPFETAAEKISKTIETIDNSKLNKEVLPKITKLIEKADKAAPSAMKLGRFVLANSIFVLLGAGIAKSIKFANEKREKIEQNYQILKENQANTAKHLVNVLNYKLAVADQSQKGIGVDTEDTKNEEKISSSKQLNNIKKSKNEQEPEDISQKTNTGKRSETTDSAKPVKTSGATKGREKIIIIYEK